MRTPSCTSSKIIKKHKFLFPLCKQKQGGERNDIDVKWAHTKKKNNVVVVFNITQLQKRPLILKTWCDWAFNISRRHFLEMTALLPASPTFIFSCLHPPTNSLSPLPFSYSFIFCVLPAFQQSSSNTISTCAWTWTYLVYFITSMQIIITLGKISSISPCF